jgi:1,4-dihydroxy-2-naphthoyl-CoA synthase
MPEIISRRDGAVATLLFSNPSKLNAMSRDMWVQLAQGIEAADADPSVKVIVLRGEGERSFVSGADISQFGEMRNRSDTQAEYERAVTEGHYLAWLLSKVEPDRPVAIVGYSYGSLIALEALEDLVHAQWTGRDDVQPWIDRSGCKSPAQELSSYLRRVSFSLRFGRGQ